MECVLDDANAMDASAKLSAQDKVIGKVRVSQPVAVGTQHLRVTINEQVQ